MKPKPDPCRRPFFCPSIADEFRVRVWNPKRDRVELLTSDIFPKFHATDMNVFALGLLVGEENIASVFFGTN